VQHLRQFRALRQPLRHLAGGRIVGVVAQGHAGQAAQDGLGIVGPHAQPQAHVGQLQTLVQRLVARHHRAHEHIATAGRVFGQGMHGHMHSQLEHIEGQTGAPGVVHGHHQPRLLPCHLHQATQVRKLQRDRACGFQPQQARPLAQHRPQ